MRGRSRGSPPTRNSSELGGQKRLSILRWNAGVGSFHVIMVQTTMRS